MLSHHTVVSISEIIGTALMDGTIRYRVVVRSIVHRAVVLQCWCVVVRITPAATVNAVGTAACSLYRIALRLVFGMIGTKAEEFPLKLRIIAIPTQVLGDEAEKCLGR